MSIADMNFWEYMHFCVACVLKRLEWRVRGCPILASAARVG